MTALLGALLLGIVAGLRSATAPAALAWAVGLGWVRPANPFADLFGRDVVRWLLAAGAIAEYWLDQHPKTPSRKMPGPFVARVISGGVCGAALGTTPGAPGLIVGALVGAVGAVIGTVGGYDARRRLALAFGRDLPAALIEDVVAIGLALVALVIVALPNVPR